MSASTTRKGKARSARMDFRTTRDVKERIELAAFLQGVSVSDFVLSNASRAAQEVIEREHRIQLGEEASLRVAEALARPARAIPELVELFRE